MSKKIVKYNKAGSVYLDCTSIKKFILMPYWDVIDSTKTRVDDIMYPLITDEESVHNPQYAVIGRYVPLAKNLDPVFYIDANGPHILYVTEVPKGNIEGHREYRFEQALWVTYWEDRDMGYLFQVVPRY